jgi:hypothetical protein
MKYIPPWTVDELTVFNIGRKCMQYRLCIFYAINKYKGKKQRNRRTNARY